MDKLKERFGDDKNALNLATMELYKKDGVNPLGGCLPILLADADLHRALLDAAATRSSSIARRSWAGFAI